MSSRKRVNRKKNINIEVKSILPPMMYNLLMMKKALKLITNNLFIFLVISGVIFAVFISVSKALFSKPNYVYARIKVSQGLWWANTSRPQIWLIAPLKKGVMESNLLGEPTAEIQSVTYYPWFDQPTSQYNAFMNVKLRVSGGGKQNSYQYNRSTLSVGSAVDFEFPTVSLSGTVIELSNSPLKNDYQEKIVVLSKSYALDWEYEDIKMGDKYFDGEDVVFEIVDKSAVDEYSSILNFDQVYTGSAVSATSFPQIRKRITIKAKIKVKKINGYYVFGEEQVVATGKEFLLALPSVILDNYRIISIQ